MRAQPPGRENLIGGHCPNDLMKKKNGVPIETRPENRHSEGRESCPREGKELNKRVLPKGIFKKAQRLDNLVLDFVLEEFAR